jgi:hypothetical protein
MKPARARLIAVAGMSATIGLMTIGCARSVVTEKPSAKQATGSAPSEILARRPQGKPPALSRREDVPAFIAWAAASTTEEQEIARQLIAAAAQHPGVVQALIAEVENVYRTDHSQALLILAILGEMRSPVAEPFLRDFIDRPLPSTGTVVDGEIIEQTAQAMLQAKAVAGLAYLRQPSSDQEVLRIIAQHPSRIVRAEAISAYLWNHGDSPEARRLVFRHVRPEEQIFVDRPRRVRGEDAAAFNRKLAEYLKAHPEIIPPAPEPFQGPRKVRPFEVSPPRF